MPSLAGTTACASGALASAAAFLSVFASVNLTIASLSVIASANFISAFLALSAMLAAVAAAIFIDIADEDDTNEDDATGDRAKEYSKVAQHVSAKQTHETTCLHPTFERYIELQKPL